MQHPNYAPEIPPSSYQQILEKNVNTLFMLVVLLKSDESIMSRIVLVCVPYVTQILHIRAPMIVPHQLRASNQHNYDRRQQVVDLDHDS